MKKQYYCAPHQPLVSRRRFVTGAAAGGVLLNLNPGSIWAQEAERQSPVTLSGREFDLNIGYQNVNFTGQQTIATSINGSVPAPTLRWREGDEVTLRVRNNLAVDSSIHWHGIILPTNMDGVPGLSFDGIRPGESYEYRFSVNQSGTFWYHSHSGFQEQTGMYGAIVIDPRDPDPVSYDREYTVMLSDWSDTPPEEIYANLKKMSHYYNFNERTVGDLMRDIEEKGVVQTWNDRRMWNVMRMSSRDIADVTGYTYTFLMNGNTPDDNWRALFARGERIRLRFINASAMTIFDVRIPGLSMRVVASDGQNIEPVTVDEFRIGVAETYDVIVEPSDDSAYTLFAQSIDRSGYARGTLTPDLALNADVPAMDHRPELTMRDMGMDMSGMSMGGMDMGGMDMSGMEMDHDMSDMEMDHNMSDMEMNHDMSDMEMDHDMTGMQQTRMDMNMGSSLGLAGHGSNSPITHPRSESGPQTIMQAEVPMNGLDDPGIGLREHMQRYGRRVLKYSDIVNLYPTYDAREPEREIQIHLTGNMDRFMWSMDGIKYADARPLHLNHNERVRITLVNDTMMVHPMHLHGLWSELETGEPGRIPRKHTVIVQPGAKISYLVTADALGRWAYHCHLLYHMPGMFREVHVS